jgi:hypothetical protein
VVHTGDLRAQGLRPLRGLRLVSGAAVPAH